MLFTGLFYEKLRCFNFVPRENEMVKARIADRTSIFVGAAFILLACIIGTGGILWRNFVEYTSASGTFPEVFSGIATLPPYSELTSPDDRDEVIFGFAIPRGDLVQFLEIMQPMLNQIVEKTGKSARIVIVSNEMEIASKVEKRLIDFGSLPAMDYIMLKKKHGIKAVLERFSTPPKRTIFLVRADDTATSLVETRGYRIAYRANDSLSGYLVPIKELKKLGIEHTDFYSQDFSSENFSDSVLGLQNDQYDCIILSSTFYHELPEETRKSMKIIHQTEPMPGGVYVTSNGYRLPYEQIITGNMMKLADTIEKNQMFAGMFMTRKPDEEAFKRLEQEYSDGL